MIFQYRIPGKHWVAGGPPLKKGSVVDIDKKVLETNNKGDVMFPMGGVEVKIPENMESFYTLVCSQGME